MAPQQEAEHTACLPVGIPMPCETAARCKVAELSRPPSTSCAVCSCGEPAITAEISAKHHGLPAVRKDSGPGVKEGKVIAKRIALVVV